LYELDTEGTATFDAAATSTSVSSTPPEAPSAAVPAVAPVVAVNGAVTAAASSDHHRLPSIKFLGKQGWEAARKGHAIAEQQPPKSVVAGKPNAVTTLFDNTILHPMYGRPRFTDAEIEALLTGGATLAPSILMHSGGAKFK
jgi:hypothetical protein